jgi:hypothetical protein
MTASTPFDAGARNDRPSPAPAASTVTRVRRRRRPSGEPPPLPRRLHTSGKRWLLLVGVVVVAGVTIGNARRAAVAVDVADYAVLSAFARIRTPWLTPAARAAGVLSNPAPLGMLAVWWATLAVLVIWRRWRHLLVAAVAMFVVTFGWPSPSTCSIAAAAGRGDPRGLGRVRAAVGADGLSHRHPRHRPVHAGPGGTAARAGKLVVVVPVAIKPFNLESSGGSTPLRITVKGDPGTYLFAKLYSATHLGSDRWYKLGRSLL